MRNIKLTIEYDGTNYHGWQSQTNAITVQDVVNNAINKLAGEKCGLLGSSRTDVGVHAMGQVANFMTGSSIPGDKFAYALNNLLPNDIVIKKSEEVGSDFHSRYSSKGKKYMFLIYNSPIPSAIFRNRAFHVTNSLNVSLMQDASKSFIGTFDFSAFRAAGSSTVSSVRTITDISLTRNNDIIVLEIMGNGFLYKMVRIIAGTLIEVGLGKINPEDITDIIESRDRKKAGKTAKAHGLYLMEIYY